MKEIILSENWKLIGQDPQNVKAEDVVKPDISSGDWMSVSVPGDVNVTLLKYSKVPDPHIDGNSREYEWVTGKEWWYMLEFDVKDKPETIAELILECVDGYSDLWFNDKYIGEIKNAFHPFKFDVTGLIRQGKNVILVRFKSIDQLLGGPRFNKIYSWFRRRAFLRKPFFSFGWDWVHAIPSLGLAGEVRVELDNLCFFNDFYIQSFISGRVDCYCEVSRAAKKTGYRINFKLSGHGQKIEKSFSRERCRSYTSVTVPKPKLWFPNGYGQPNLYDYSVELIVNGRVEDTKKGRMGFRETRIAERPFTPDAGPGLSFEIEINGHTVFCKGGCWIPLEIWPVNARKEQYEVHLKRAKEAGFTMIRIWGGGFYEKEIFYELCDKYGLLVWQDFMFACEGYPVNMLMDEIIEEANYQIRRLRNHPCMALWCGMNEDAFSWDLPEDNYEELKDLEDFKKGDPWKVNRFRDDPILLTMILRGLVSKYGLGVPYVESSPESREDAGNLPNSGNCHISCIDYYLEKPLEQFREFFEQVCSFDSEYCADGPCSIKTLKAYLSQGNLSWPPNEVWKYRMSTGSRDDNSTGGTHYGFIERIAGKFFGEIDSLEKFVKYGQLMQAEIVRAEVEGYRTFRPNSGGTLMWMYNDCWPACDWSIIDYYYRLKPSYYSSKRACQSFLSIILEKKKNMNFYFGNDSLQRGKVKLEFGQETLDGKIIWSKKKNISLPHNTTEKFYSVPRGKLSLASGDFLFIQAAVNGKKLPKITYFPDLWKDIPWPEPGVTCKFLKQVKKDGLWTLFARIISNKFARSCYLYFKDGREDVTFSDNYFDLPAGTPYTIEITSENRIDEEKIAVGHWLTEWE